jgi:hypothetical protein
MCARKKKIRVYRAYDPINLRYTMLKQGDIFGLAGEYFEDMDTTWFAEEWMKSRIRLTLDFGEMKWRNKSPYENIEGLIEKTDGYKNGENTYGRELTWIGMMYGFIQWKYRVLSSELLEELPVARMADVFYPLHEAGWDVGADKLMNMTNFTKGRESKFLEVERQRGYLEPFSMLVDNDDI